LMFVGLIWLIGLVFVLGNTIHIIDSIRFYKVPDPSVLIISLLAAVGLCTFLSEQDIFESRILQTNLYINKSVAMDPLAIVQPTTQFWSTIVTLPEGC
jgi:hypothetical protein